MPIGSFVGTPIGEDLLGPSGSPPPSPPTVGFISPLWWTAGAGGAGCGFTSMQWWMGGVGSVTPPIPPIPPIVVPKPSEGGHRRKQYHPLSYEEKHPENFLDEYMTQFAAERAYERRKREDQEILAIYNFEIELVLKALKRDHD